jgi:lipoprotein NlpD
MLHKLFIYCFFLCLLMLTACFGGGNYAPVIERQERISLVPKSHEVVRGDSLYSIAWRYSLDFKGLASTNRIKPPYTIYPGQKIQLKGRVSSSNILSSKASKKAVSRAAKSSKTVTAKSSRKRPQPHSISKVVADRSSYPFRWQWPAKGKILRRYSSGSAVHRGVDIQGKLGESVRAANSGKVVYAGGDLVGYGNLLIIKHDEHYLSAYGHNSKLVVREGELVKVGQKIAEFGDTGADRVKLHFEIRRDGKPVNPLNLLSRGK